MNPIDHQMFSHDYPKFVYQTPDPYPQNPIKMPKPFSIDPPEKSNKSKKDLSKQKDRSKKKEKDQKNCA